MEKKYDIFISYSRKDCKLVLPFVEELESRDFKVWIDTSNIDYGATFPDHIAQALDESDSMLFMCTQNSVQNSPYCKKELGYARANGLNITAVLVDGYMPKKGWFALEYNDVNCVNTSDKNQLYRLYDALENKYVPEKVAERRAKIVAAREAARKKVREEEERRLAEQVGLARREEMARIEEENKKKQVELSKIRQSQDEDFDQIIRTVFLSSKNKDEKAIQTKRTMAIENESWKSALSNVAIIFGLNCVLSLWGYVSGYATMLNESLDVSSLSYKVQFVIMSLSFIWFVLVCIWALVCFIIWGTKMERISMFVVMVALVIIALLVAWKIPYYSYPYFTMLGRFF